MEESPSRKIILQLVKKFPKFYGAQMFNGIAVTHRPAYCPISIRIITAFFNLDIPLCLYKSQNNCITS
jgi:hypothetical protein